MDRFKDSKGGVEQREKHKLCVSSPGSLAMAIANNEKDLFSLILHHKHDFNPNSPA